MAKFTDDYFIFPIKIYDGFSLRRALDQEEKEMVDAPVPADWILGYARLSAKEFEDRRVCWYDFYSRESSVEQAAKEGFDQTMVVSDRYGEFGCMWPRKKFEEKLNEFMEKRNIVTLEPKAST